MVAGGGATAKVAPTFCAAFIVNTQLAVVPLQAPLQVEKTYPVAGTAVSVTGVPLAKDWLHPVVPPLHDIPAGLDVTVPPLPLATCSAKYWTTIEKVAPTLCVAAASVRVQLVAVPEHEPLQPENEYPAAGVAVSATMEPTEKAALHVEALPLQLIPVGLDDTVPEPPTVTCSVLLTPIGAKLAPTFSAAFNVTTHDAAAPEQAPVHPTKIWPAAGAAVSVTLVPEVKD